MFVALLALFEGIPSGVGDLLSVALGLGCFGVLALLIEGVRRI